MSSEHPPFSDNYEYDPEDRICSDRGMDDLLEEMLTTEACISSSQSYVEVRELMEELEDKFEVQGINETDLIATVNGKIRPYLLYSVDGEVDYDRLKEIEDSGDFPERDDQGYYRWLNQEELHLMGRTLFATVNPTTYEEYTHQVGFICSYSKNDSTELPCFLHPAEIEDMELPYPTLDGAHDILTNYKKFSEDLNERACAAEQSEAFVDWLDSLCLDVPVISDAKKAQLKRATELYMQDKAAFDREPYRLLLRGKLELIDDNGDRRLRELDETEECYAYIHGIELREERHAEDVNWLPCLKANLVIDDPIENDTLLIPTDSIISFLPTLARSNRIQSIFEYAEPNDSESELSQSRLEHYEQRALLREQEKAAIRTVHQELETHDSELMQGLLEYLKKTTTLEDQLAVADTLMEVYDIPSLVWQDEDKREHAADMYRRAKVEKLDWNKLSPNEQQNALSLDEAYFERYQRDDALIREVFMAVLEKRHTPKMNNAKHKAMRERLYARMIVDYKEPIESNWYRLVDAIFPGEPYFYDHPRILEYSQEVRDSERWHRTREASIRNLISQELYDDKAVDETDFMYQVYRNACEDLVEFRYLDTSEKERLLLEVEEKTGLSPEAVAKLARVMSSISNENV